MQSLSLEAPRRAAFLHALTVRESRREAPGLLALCPWGLGWLASSERQRDRGLSLGAPRPH